MKKTIGQTIADQRKAQGMTQKDLADKMNVTDKAVSKWERDLSIPDIASIPKLAGILQISVEELLTSTEEPGFEEVGDICREIASYLEPYNTPYEIIEDRAAAVEKSILTAQKGDVVILAAKGEEVYQKVRGGFEPYESDLAIAKRCLNME